MGNSWPKNRCLFRCEPFRLIRTHIAMHFNTRLKALTLIESIEKNASMYSVMDGKNKSSNYVFNRTRRDDGAVFISRGPRRLKQR